MPYTVFITPPASADIMIAFEYYNSKSDCLGKRMTEEVDKLLNIISAMPQAYSMRYRNIRAAKIPSFPFLVFYKINEMNRSIQVLRVFNTHQQPFW
jgi:hypothetical protein